MALRHNGGIAPSPSNRPYTPSRKLCGSGSCGSRGSYLLYANCPVLDRYSQNAHGRRGPVDRPLPVTSANIGEGRAQIARDADDWEHSPDLQVRHLSAVVETRGSYAVYVSQPGQ